MACLLAYYGVKALRWRYLIAPFAHARARELLPAVLAGLAGNYVFPHFGEIARAVLAGRRLNAPPGALLGSIAIERFFDFLALLVFVLVVLLPLGRHAMTRSARRALRRDPVRGPARRRRAVRVPHRGLPRVRAPAAAPLSPAARETAVYHLRQARVGLGAIGAPRLLAPIFGSRCCMARYPRLRRFSLRAVASRSRSQAPCRLLL